MEMGDKVHLCLLSSHIYDCKTLGNRRGDCRKSIM